MSTPHALRRRARQRIRALARLWLRVLDALAQGGAEEDDRPRLWLRGVLRFCESRRWTLPAVDAPLLRSWFYAEARTREETHSLQHVLRRALLRMSAICLAMLDRPQLDTEQQDQTLGDAAHVLTALDASVPFCEAFHRCWCWLAEIGGYGHSASPRECP